MKRPVFFGLHAVPTRGLSYALAAAPFVLAIVLYVLASDARHRENPQDRLLPSASQMAAAINRVAFTEDRRTGKYLLWNDTAASLKRIALGVVIATLAALWIGLNMGMFSGMSATLSPFITFIAMVPPLALLPILFITFGLGEVGKIALITLGTFPILTRDVTLAVRRIPREQTVKALTLGASELAVVYKVVLPQIMPRLLDSVRLSLGAAWLFLIAAEAIASTEGLGYRIFLVRRYMAMDVIIPYVMWITLLGFTFDYALRAIIRTRYSWYRAE